VTSVGRSRVAIDIGNSAAKWSIRQADSASPTLPKRVSIKVDEWPTAIIHDVQSHCSLDSAVEWRIAAVNAPAQSELIAVLSSRFDRADVQRVTWRHVPMNPQVRYPDVLGIDRLLACWQASQVYPGLPLVVVDAGSAITVDCADPHGNFLGGAIIPGLSLQFESLRRGTDALPAVGFEDSPEIDETVWAVPATDTVSAIRSGILLGTAGAIDRLIEQSAQFWRRVQSSPSGGPSEMDASWPDPRFQTLLTGGDSRRLSALVRSPHVVHDRLVLDALLNPALRWE